MKKLIALLALPLLASVSQARPIFDSFGQFDSFTPGTGIPNDAVATTSFNYLGLDFTMGLTITERCGNPAVGNNGAGIFTAEAGSNVPYCSSIEGAKWNFGYFFGFNPTTDIGSFADLDTLIDATDGNHRLDVRLMYDVNPGNARNWGQLRLFPTLFEQQFDQNGTLIYDPSWVSAVQGSQNAMFNFLYDDSIAFRVPNNGATFNPDINGIYDFQLRANFGPQGDRTTERTRVRVEVPEPSILSVLGAACLAFCAFRFRRKI